MFKTFYFCSTLSVTPIKYWGRTLTQEKEQQQLSIQRVFWYQGMFPMFMVLISWVDQSKGSQFVLICCGRGDRLLAHNLLGKLDSYAEGERIIDSLPSLFPNLCFPLSKNRIPPGTLSWQYSRNPLPNPFRFLSFTLCGFSSTFEVS